MTSAPETSIQSQDALQQQPEISTKKSRGLLDIMQLIKFCKPEHNIYRGAKLQIGNLFGYRRIENSEVRDETEGKYEFTIEFPEEIELDRRWANLLLQGVVAFGKTEDAPRFPGSF